MLFPQFNVWSMWPTFWGSLGGYMYTPAPWGRPSWSRQQIGRFSFCSNSMAGKSSKNIPNILLMEEVRCQYLHVFFLQGWGNLRCPNEKLCILHPLKVIGYSQRETIVFQPSIFRCELLVSGRVFPTYLLMVQKSRVHQLRLVLYPIFLQGFIHSSGSPDFFHQQYL